MKAQEARDKKAEKLKENRHKILIVDDSRMNRLTLQRILEDEYDVIQARAGAEGLELVYKHMIPKGKAPLLRRGALPLDRPAAIR